MLQPLYPILPALAIAGFVVFCLVWIGLSERRRQGDWRFPALLMALFGAWSIYTVIVEGLFGFWANHTSGAWGNQVWFDLLLAIGIGWTLLLPRARRLGMPALPWFGLILCTGSIGLLAMFARCLMLESRQTHT